MCFEVILNYLWVTQGVGSQFWLFLKLRPVAVHIFMILSFYLMGKHFLVFLKNHLENVYGELYILKSDGLLFTMQLMVYLILQ